MTTTTTGAARRTGARMRWAPALLAACAASLTTAALAGAGTYGPAGCWLNSGASCASSERHTYDDSGASAGGGSLVAAYLRNPSTGTIINVSYGYGSTYSYYRNNTDVFLDGYWANASGSSPVWVSGTFNY